MGHLVSWCYSWVFFWGFLCGAVFIKPMRDSPLPERVIHTCIHTCTCMYTDSTMKAREAETELYSAPTLSLFFTFWVTWTIDFALSLSFQL